MSRHDILCQATGRKKLGNITPSFSCCLWIYEEHTTQFPRMFFGLSCKSMAIVLVNLVKSLHDGMESEVVMNGGVTNKLFSK